MSITLLLSRICAIVSYTMALAAISSVSARGETLLPPPLCEGFSWRRPQRVSPYLSAA